MAFTYESYAYAPMLTNPYFAWGMTNFGGDYQIFPVESSQTSQIGCYFNPAAQQNLWGSNPWFGFNTFPMQLPNVNDYLQGLANPILNNMASQKIAACLTNISSAKTQIEKLLEKEGTTDEQKAQLNDLLKELKAQEDKLLKLTKNTAKYTPQEAYNTSGEIEAAIKEIVNKINKIGAGEKVETSSEETEEADETSKKDKADKTKETDETDETTKKDKADKTGKAEEKEGTVGKACNGKINDSAADVVDAFYSATYRWGTDSDTVKSVIDSIDSENVMDIMAAWNKYHSSVNGESFMEAFMYDAEYSLKREGCKKIELALRRKADALGIYEDCRDDFSKIDKELGGWLSWAWIDNGIYKNFDNIIKKIADKMGGEYAKYGEPGSSVDKKA